MAQVQYLTLEEIEELIEAGFRPLHSSVPDLADETLEFFRNDVRRKLSNTVFPSISHKRYSIEPLYSGRTDSRLSLKILDHHYRSLVPDGTRVCRGPIEKIGQTRAQASLDLTKHWANAASRPTSDALDAVLAGSKPKNLSMTLHFIKPITKTEAITYSNLIGSVTGRDVYIRHQLIERSTSSQHSRSTSTSTTVGSSRSTSVTSDEYDWWDNHESGLRSTFLRITIDTYRLYIARISPYSIIDKLQSKTASILKGEGSSPIVVFCSPSIVRQVELINGETGLTQQVRRYCYIDVFANVMIEDYGGTLLSETGKLETFFKDQVLNDFKSLVLGGITGLTDATVQFSPYITVLSDKTAKGIPHGSNPHIFTHSRPGLKTTYLRLDREIARVLGLYHNPYIRSVIESTRGSPLYRDRMAYLFMLLDGCRVRIVDDSGKVHDLTDMQIEPTLVTIYDTDYVIVYTNNPDPLLTIGAILNYQDKAMKYFITVSGSNLHAVAMIPGIDIDMCTSNSISSKVGEILPAFGIEGTVTAMLRNLDVSLRRVGSNLNTYSLVDIIILLTRIGVPTGVRYHKITLNYPLVSSLQSQAAHMQAKLSYAVASTGATEQAGSHMFNIMNNSPAHRETWRSVVTLNDSIRTISGVIDNVTESLSSKNANPKTYYTDKEGEERRVGRPEGTLPDTPAGATMLAVNPLIRQIIETSITTSDEHNQRARQIAAPLPTTEVTLPSIVPLLGIDLGISPEEVVEDDLTGLSAFL